MYLTFLILATSFTGCVGNFTCKALDGESITGFRLWQRNLELTCSRNFFRGAGWLETTCRVGINITTDLFHVITFESLKSNNSISCTLASDNSSRWEMNDIDMDPMNETTFVNGMRHQSIDVYFGYAQNFIIFNSRMQVLKLTPPPNFNGYFSSYEIDRDESIISRIEVVNYSWLRIHFTPITTKHAGSWEIQKEFEKSEKQITTFEINVLTNFSCTSNNSASCLAREFSSIIEIQCSASRISLFQWKENIVCRINNETLNSTTESFFVDSSQREGKRVVCFSRNTNQTWESSPIKHFHRETINTTKAISVENSNRRDCKYSWIAPDLKTEISDNVLDWFRMESHGYGKYQGIISCSGSCSYINYVVNFVDPTPSTTTSTISPTTTFLFASVVSNSAYIPTTPSTDRRDFSIQIWFINTIVSIVLIFLVCGIFWKLRNRRLVKTRFYFSRKN